MRVSFVPLLALVVLLPTVAFALTITPADLYTDVRVGSPEAVGINLLTREGIVEGYGDGFFGVNRTINRAEFLKIAMKVTQQSSFSAADCFPDVHATDWFSSFVCAAKTQGVIQGKVEPRRFGALAYFDPATTVTYGEALKMLTQLFSYNIPAASGHWAERYYRASTLRGVDLPITITLDTPLTRGHAVRLAAAFLAESKGQLAEFRRAEHGEYANNTSSSISSSSSSRSSSQSSSFSSSVSNRPLDPLPDTSIRSQFLLLGETGPIVAAANIFIDAEPLDVTTIGINVNVESSTIQGFLVYDENRRYLGKATLDPTVSTNRRYNLRLSPGTLMVDKRSSVSVYIRPALLMKDLGGLSNQILQVGNIVIEGNGMWSSEKYTKATSQTFETFVTARSTITSITNSLGATEPLVIGTNQRIGSFRFEGRKTDPLAKIDVTSLLFNVGTTGGVTLSNVRLMADGMSDRFSCTPATGTVSCTGIPRTFGSLTDGPRTFTLYGDIAATDSVSASLQLSLNTPGSVTEVGSVTWSDGTTTFSWVGLVGPLAAGTAYRY